MYPGGSISTPESDHFLWSENYFCDMMNSKAINGKHNSARLFSITALISLCIGITSFFIWFASQKSCSDNSKLVLKISGITTMLFSCLIFTQWHNQLIILAIVSGIIPLSIILNVILKNINSYDIALTIFVFTFLVGYVLIYYLNIMPNLHPIVQKCVVLIGFIWIIRIQFRNEKMKV
jgi:hypothetical protein